MWLVVAGLLTESLENDRRSPDGLGDLRSNACGSVRRPATTEGGISS